MKIKFTPVPIFEFKNRYKSLYVKYYSENRLIKIIDSMKENDIIIFPLYHNPDIELLKISIEKIREKELKCRIYCTGYYSIINSDEISKLDINGIIINNEFPLITIDNKIIELPNQKTIRIRNKKPKFLIRESYRHIICNSNSCKRRCTFCMNSLVPNHSKKINEDYLLNQISFKDEKAKHIFIHIDNILDYFSIEQMKNFFQKIYEETKCEEIIIWACVDQFFDQHDLFCKTFTEVPYKININLGIESFSSKQLKRFGKKSNYTPEQIINFINNIPKEKIKIDTLYFIFEPWVKPEDILINIKYHRQIDKETTYCDRYSMILRIFHTRKWNPIKNTIMYNKAVEENLIDEKTLEWKFINKQSEKIYKTLCEIFDSHYNHFYKNKINYKEKDSKCICCLGKKGKYVKKYDIMEDLLIEWIEKDLDENLYNKMMTYWKDLLEEISINEIEGYKESLNLKNSSSV